MSEEVERVRFRERVVKELRLQPSFLDRSLNLVELQSLARDMASGISAPHVVLLLGPMGAGKTQFVRFLGEALGVSGELNSPTFAFHHEAQGKDAVLHHFDLYRIEGDEDLMSTGFWDVFSEDKAIIAIEWPERLKAEDLPRTVPVQLIEFKKGSSPEVRELSSWKS